MASKVAAFRMPCQIIFGNGAAERVGEEAKRFGATHAFVLSDPNLQKLGVTERIVASISGQGEKRSAGGGTVAAEPRRVTASV